MNRPSRSTSLNVLLSVMEKSRKNKFPKEEHCVSFSSVFCQKQKMNIDRHQISIFFTIIFFLRILLFSHWTLIGPKCSKMSNKGALSFLIDESTLQVRLLQMVRLSGLLG